MYSCNKQPAQGCTSGKMIFYMIFLHLVQQAKKMPELPLHICTAHQHIGRCYLEEVMFTAQSPGQQGQKSH